MTGFLDGLFGWAKTAVENMTLNENRWLAFLVFAFAVWAGLAFAVKVLAVLGSRVVPFVCRVGIATVYLLTLNADYLLTQIVRSLGGKPFGAIYAVGERATAALPAMMDATRAGGRWWLRESRTLANRKLLILATVLVIGWWNGTYCGRQSADTCKPPSAGVTRPLTAFAHDVGTFLGVAS
jgi:hypothetical protein